MDIERFVSSSKRPRVNLRFFWLACHSQLEDHPMTCKWLIIPVIVSPEGSGLWDPLQMAFLWLRNGSD